MIDYQEIGGRTGCLHMDSNSLPVYRVSDREWILMDSGLNYEGSQLMDFLDREGIQVLAVLTSHAHFDHMGNHRLLQEEMGAKLVMTAMDAGSVKDATSLKTCFYSSTAEEIRRKVGYMVCQADRLLFPWERQFSIEGVTFWQFPLPGHAASHVGYRTQDGVLYVGDALMGREILADQSLAYMLDWQLAFQTMKEISRIPARVWILAHGGPVTEREELAEENIRVYQDILQEMWRLLEREFFLEEALELFIPHQRLKVKNPPYARMAERIIRSGLEYLTDSNKLEIQVKRGRILYKKAQIY